MERRHADRVARLVAGGFAFVIAVVLGVGLGSTFVPPAAYAQWWDASAVDAPIAALVAGGLAIVVGGVLASLFVGRVRKVVLREQHEQAELAAAELRTRELAAHARMLAILEALPVGVLVVKRDGTTFHANARATASLGAEHRAYLAGTDQIYPAERAPLVRALHGEHGSVGDMEIERDGKRVALQVEACPVRAADGHVELAVAAFAEVEMLRRQVFEDPLTGLPNRAALDEAFTRLRNTCLRADRPLSIALVDLDHFKAINDRHGHQLGDEVLCRVAAMIANSVRAADIVGRWGGEKIALILPVTDRLGASQLVDRLLELVACVPFAGADAEQFCVTFSAGIAEVLPGDRTLADALRRADAALYTAKAAGRARVHCDAKGRSDARRPAAA